MEPSVLPSCFSALPPDPKVPGSTLDMSVRLGVVS